MIKGKTILLLIFFTIFIGALVFAQDAQEVGQVEKVQRDIEKEKVLRERIEREKEEPVIEKGPLVKEPLPQSAEKVLIEKINVTGVIFLSQREIDDIVLPFEDKKLTLGDMQKIADLITDLYRQKGYITSRAYLPPQKIEKGVLEIKIIEGITGEITLKGNRYFKSSLLREKIALKKGEPFNYNTLRKNLSKINEHRDRNSRAVLTPGKEPSTTDIVVEVKDRLPIHAGFEWDNFGSRYVGRDRYQASLTHNNLLGLDDILILQYQLAGTDAYWLTSLRYLLPVSEGLTLGFFSTRTKLDLGREYEDLESRGKSRLYSLYGTQALIDEENIALSLNLGFDYKDIFNFQAGSETSRDRLRIAKMGLDMDMTDKTGRTIIVNEFDFGIPEIMGGLKRKDDRASRTGSGGRFIKDNLSLMRLQNMPFDSSLLWKNQFQFSPYILPSAEQFQIGGIGNVRGYPAAEYVGDSGRATTLEWSFPPYFIPKSIEVPVSPGVKVYDALRLVLFIDWAKMSLKRPQAGEQKHEELKAAGWGFRLTLPGDFSAKVDFGWPIDDNTPSDSNHLHTWAQVSKTF